MIGAKQYEPNDLRLNTIENLFWQQITQISRRSTNAQLDTVDIQCSDVCL